MIRRAGGDHGDLPRRLEEARSRIGAAGRDPGSVRIVAVTKGFGPEAVRAALAAGIPDIGENYAGELLSKAAACPEAAGHWHYLGAVQRNKVGRLASMVSCWQAVDRLVEGRAIAGRRPGARVLVQVEVSGMPGRGGRVPDEVPELVRALRGEDLSVEGLMAVGPPGPPEHSRSAFAAVSRLADELDLAVRSMGMSDDLEVAVSEGSTMVRLGRALFGDRPQPR